MINRSDKVVLITGASRGIGAATARLLAVVDAAGDEALESGAMVYVGDTEF